MRPEQTEFHLTRGDFAQVTVADAERGCGDHRHANFAARADQAVAVHGANAGQGVCGEGAGQGEGSREREEGMSAVFSMLAQISAATRPTEKRTKFNPRPAGLIQPGSATEAVLAFLESSPGLKTEAQIIWATKCSHSAVSWALLRLRAWKRIDAVSDPSRNSRYLRYRATALMVKRGEANE